MELSVLLQRDQLVPIFHNAIYGALRENSSMLTSCNGLDTAELPTTDVTAKKLAELVKTWIESEMPERTLLRSRSGELLAKGRR